MRLKFALLLLYSISGASIDAGWISRKAEGWAWYEDRSAEEPEAPVEPAMPVRSIEEARKTLESKLAAAVLSPTEENVRAYMEEQKKWVDQAGRFSKMWAKVLLDQPLLDETSTGMPTSQYGIQVHKDMLNRQKQEFIAGLVKDHGLFFFYEGNSPISHAFSKVVTQFQKKYNWTVLSISMDGVPIPELGEMRTDNGIAKTLGVQVLPALYMINPTTNEATPIAFGLVSLEQLEANVLLQFLETKEFDNASEGTDFSSLVP